MTQEAQERSARLIEEAEDRLAKIRIERDAISGYLENLRGVLSHAESLTADR